MIEYVEGDLFATKADIRVNTVNCVGVMGAGAALAFKQRNPEMFNIYRAECKRGKIRPGVIHVWGPNSNGMDDCVVNFPTKMDWREKSKYEYIESGLVALRSYLKEQGSVTVALPALGCGNGGLEWERVSRMIQDALNDLEAHIKVFAPSTSISAGKTAAAEMLANDIASAHAIGFSTLPENDGFVLRTSSTLYYKGNHDLLSIPWVAMMPSRSPQNRELNAISSVLKVFSESKPDFAMAFILNNKTSEELADSIARQGLNALLILPFGALTRKSIANWPNAKLGEKVGVLSCVHPRDKWSPKNFSSAMKLLQTNSRASLITDPSPEWMCDKTAKPVIAKPVFYLNYGKLDSRDQILFSGLNATAISRNARSKQPNLDPIHNLLS